MSDKLLSQTVLATSQDWCPFLGQRVKLPRVTFFSLKEFLAFFTLKGGGVEDCIPELNVSH